MYSPHSPIIISSRASELGGETVRVMMNSKEYPYSLSVSSETQNKILDVSELTDWSYKSKEI